MTKPYFDKQTQDDIKYEISQMISKLQFFAQTIDQANEERIKTNLCLIELSLEELCDLTGVTTDEIRGIQHLKHNIQILNNRICQLETNAAEQMLSETGICLQRLEDIFRTWYEAAGFHYADITFYDNGIRADFTSETREGQHLSKEPALFIDFTKRFPSISNTKDIEIVKDKDSYNRYNIINNDKARNAIKNLFKEALPDSYIMEWTSGIDGAYWPFQFKIFVPYTDITNLLNKSEDSEI